MLALMASLESMKEPEAEDLESRPLQTYSKERMNEVIRELDVIYRGQAENDSYVRVSRSVGQAQVGEGSADAYGEICSSSVVKLLDLVGARPGQRFYDLGSGLGKVVVLAWLLGLNATGVELVHERWDAACAALDHARSTGMRFPDESNQLSFLHASFFDVDFSDADILFTNSLLFTEKMMHGLSLAVQRMKPGSKILTINPIMAFNLRMDGLFSAVVSWSKNKLPGFIQSVNNISEPVISFLEKPIRKDEVLVGVTEARGEVCKL